MRCLLRAHSTIIPPLPRPLYLSPHVYLSTYLHRYLLISVAKWSPKSLDKIFLKDVGVITYPILKKSTKRLETY